MSFSLALLLGKKSRSDGDGNATWRYEKRKISEKNHFARKRYLAVAMAPG